MGNTLLGLGGYGRKHRVATPILGNQAVLRKSPLDSLQVRIGFVDLVDRHKDRHLGGAGMIDGLDSLRHDAVVRRNDEHHDIGYFGASRAHRRERFVAGGIQESYASTVHLYVVCTDMLRDAAMLLGGHMGAAD